MSYSNFQLILTESNGTYAIPDLQITEKFATTFSIQSVADITQRKDVISKNIIFPGTKNNNRIFNNLFSFNRESDSTLPEALFANYSPKRGVKCTLYENNIAIITGTLTIQEISKQRATGAYTYQGTITGNLKTFFGVLGDTLLQDLDYFDSLFSYRTTDIIDSWEFADDSVIVFPSIDFGNGKAPKVSEFDFRNFRPGVYARWYIYAILKQFGYSYKSDFLDSDAFKRIYIPFSDQVFGNQIFGDIVSTDGVEYYVPHADKFFNSIAFNYLPTNDYITQEPSVSIHGTYGDASGFVNIFEVFKFERFSTIGAVINYDFRLTMYDLPGTCDVTIFSVNPNNTINESNRLVTKTIAVGPHDNYLSGTIELPVADYDKGFRFLVGAYGGQLYYQATASNTGIVFGNPNPAQGTIFAYDEGDYFNLKTCVPKETKCLDMLRSLLNAFNMYMTENPENDRELLIEPYDGFYNQTNNPKNYALDWTKKIDNGSLLINVNTSLPKTYNFKFKEDSDYYNKLYKNKWAKGYGDASINNRSGTSDAQTLELLFAPTVVVTPFGDDKTMPAIFDGELLDKKTFKSQMRLLYNNGTASCDNYNFSYAVGEPGSLTYNVVSSTHSVYNTSHHVQYVGGTYSHNLQFGLPDEVYFDVTGYIYDVPTMYTDYYQNLITEINDTNIFSVECDAHLNEYDVSGLDLRKPIFISTTQGQAYFKIMEVNYYNSGEVSAIKLQKIII